MTIVVSVTREGKTSFSHQEVVAVKISWPQRCQNLKKGGGFSPFGPGDLSELI